MPGHYEDEEGEEPQSVYDGYELAETAEKPPEIELESGVSLEWFPKQLEWWTAVKSGLYNFMAYGGAIRGGKTFTILMTITALMRAFPRSRHIIVRKDLPLIRKHVIPSVDKIRRYTGNFLGVLNKTEWSVTATNGSQMIFVPESLKDDPELEDFRGAEANTFTLEESSELSNKMKVKAIERAGSYVIPPDREQMIAISRAKQQLGLSQSEASRLYGPKQCPPFVFFTFNPADNWVRDDIYDPWERGELKAPWYFLPATIHDNPYNPPGFIKSIEQLRDEDFDAYERFVLGKWGNIRVENQLIDPSWVAKAKAVQKRPGERRLGGDIARYGRDSTVFAEVDGNAVVSVDQFRHIDTAESGTIVTNRHRNRHIPARNIVIDVNGLGGGTADMARSNGVDVREFNGGERPVRRVIGRRPVGSLLVGQRSFYHFKNLWSQAAWEAREKLRKGEVAITAKNANLTRHLASFRYEITNKEINVWSSEKVREELGFSPDVGVAVILALFEFPERTRHRGAPSVVLNGGHRGSRPSHLRRGTRIA